jgi:hypothetical protein
MVRVNTFRRSSFQEMEAHILVCRCLTRRWTRRRRFRPAAGASRNTVPARKNIQLAAWVIAKPLGGNAEIFDATY